jgi:hypothetical protein
MSNGIAERGGKNEQAREPGQSRDALAAGRPNWLGANLRGSSMSYVNLDHADFRGADLREVNFTGSSLRYADFRGSMIQGANFQRGSLYGAKMQGAECQATDFRNCDLRQANFGGAYLEGAVLPQPERPVAPSEIGRAPATQKNVWRVEEVDRGKKTQNGNTGKGQAEQQQRERGRRQ